MQEAEKLSQRIAILGHGGRIMCIGTPERIREGMGRGCEIVVRMAEEEALNNFVAAFPKNLPTSTNGST